MLLHLRMSKKSSTLVADFAKSLGRNASETIFRPKSVEQGGASSSGCAASHASLSLSEGKMAEWSIASVLKTEVRRRTGGSNPSLSAVKSIRGHPFRTPPNSFYMG